MRKHFLSLCSFPLLLVWAGQSHAKLVGDEVTVNWIAPEPFPEVVSNTFIVSEGIDLDGTWAVQQSLDIQDSAIVVDLRDNTVGLANGLIWEFLDLDWVGMPGEIIDASVTTNYTGWSDTFLSFGPHSVSVNFQNFVSLDGTNDIFDINITAQHVPIPAAVWLFGSGLLVLLGMSRRKKA